MDSSFFALCEVPPSLLTLQILVGSGVGILLVTARSLWTCVEQIARGELYFG